MGWNDLERAPGPNCSICGCNQSEILRPPKPNLAGGASWWGSGMARCLNPNCRAHFHFREVAANPATLPTVPPGFRPVQVAEPVVETVDVALTTPVEAVQVEAPEPVVETPDPPVTTPEVPYIRVRCPKCQSPDTPIKQTRRPIRYHACRECGHRFKSREE